jgi:hypothetical protein
VKWKTSRSCPAMWIRHCSLLLFAAAMALACGGDETTVETEDGAFTVEADDGGVRISGEKEGVGEVEGLFGEDAKIPDAFPKDVPVYPDATVVAGMASGEGGMVTLQTGDDLDEIVAFYREELQGEGWSLESEMNLGGQRILPIEKAGRSGAVHISRKGDDTTILIIVNAGD